MKRAHFVLSAATLLLAVSAVQAAPVMMSPEWAVGFCETWNKDPVLTQRLLESGWIRNDKGRGFKVMQVYREDCKDSPRIELKVSEKDGKVTCTHGGKAEAKLDSSADYLMWAETNRWQEMGKGEYGPKWAMFMGRLHFDGPMGEAMGNMGPFENFLLLVGKVPGETSSCPAK